jgi:lipopolysaccharide transport system permease protein
MGAPVISSIRAVYGAVWKYRTFMRFVADRQLAASVHRTMFGRAWFLLIPLAQVLVYYFIVVVIFKTHATFEVDPIVTIMMGLMHYALLVNAASFAVPAIQDNEGILLQIRIEPLVLVAIGFWKSLRISWLAIIAFFLLYAFRGPAPGPEMAAYPLVLAAWILLCWVGSMFIASLSVFLRDLNRLVPMLIQFAMYLSPVVYTLSFVGEDWRHLYLANPIAAVFALFQWTLLGGAFPGWNAIALLAASIAALFVAAQVVYNWGRYRFTKAL